MGAQYFQPICIFIIIPHGHGFETWLHFDSVRAYHLPTHSKPIPFNYRFPSHRTDEPVDDPEELSVLGRSASSDDHKLSVIVADKIWRFIQSRSVKWKAFRAADVVVASGAGGKLNFGVSVDTRKLLEEGRGKMKNYGPILMAFVMKAGIVGALVLKGIALLVGKALLVSKLALLLASVIGIKKLLHKKHVTYEVVAHPPEHHHHVDTYSSGWARAFDGFVESFSKGLEKNLAMKDADEMAYGGQMPQ